MAKPIVITEQPIQIGRGEHNDVVLASDLQASRDHAVVYRQGGVFYVDDRHSVNHTFVNDLEISGPQPLAEGDTIRVGQTRFWIQDGRLIVPDDAGVRSSGISLLLPKLLLGLGVVAVLLGGAWLLMNWRGSRPQDAVVAVIGQGGRTGSGVIVDQRGLVLTSYSLVAGLEKIPVGDALRSEVAPSVWYLAKVVQADKDWDLAVLLLTNQMAGGSPLTERGGLPVLSLGNSDSVPEGETLEVIGFHAVALPAPAAFTQAADTKDAIVGRVHIFEQTGLRSAFELDRPMPDAGYQGGAVMNKQSGKLVGLVLPPGLSATPGITQALSATLQNLFGTRPSANTMVRPINVAVRLIERAKQEFQ